jgi:glycosyltransferase involved in cell wall biosynthesis
LYSLFIVFAAVAGIQIIYFIVFLIAIYSRDKDKKVAPVPVSVIVCAHDEEQNLRELIPLLLQQQYPEFEVIIVNDRSNDDTYDFLLEETKKHERLRMVHVPNKPGHINGKKYAITLGIKAAKHEWILLTDADCRPHSTSWIKTMSEKCADDKDIVLGYSPYQQKKGMLNLFIRFETVFTAIQYVSFAILGIPYMGVGRNLMYRKSLFLKNKGFDGFAELTGGDDDLFVNRYANRKNTVVSLGEQALVFSNPKSTWSQFFNQKVRHLAAGKRYKFKHKLWLAIFSLSSMASWVAGIFLLFDATWFPWASSVLIFRLFLVSFTFYEATNRFGHKFEFWAVPLLDFLFVIYYLSTAPVALLTKKQQWRN